MNTTFPRGHQDLGHDTHLVDIDLYREGLAACYVVRHQDELALLDCGTPHSAHKVLQTIEAMGASPEQVRWVIPTHVHLDHASGAGALMAACPNAELVAHPNGYPHLVDPSRLQAGAIAVYGEADFQRDFGDIQPIEASRAVAAEDGQTFALGDSSLTYIHTPGHANHHGCIFDPDSAYLFTGDTFGLGYQELVGQTPYLVATTSPVAFDPDAWFASIDHMLALEPMAVCLTHFSKHENPAAMAPMLRDSIQAHVDIALTEENNTEEGRGERLRSAIDALLVGGAIAHLDISEASARAVLSNDIELNAQGLQVWLARRAKRRAQP